ncbi:MAG: MmcQ/YjbR family DNA-binding protein [Rubrivivax sp.]
MKLDAVRRHALALPEAVEQPHFERTSFRVRGKIFATAAQDGQHLHLFVDEQQRERALAMYPAFTEPLRWGDKVVGLRLTLRGAPPATVQRLLQQAWAHRGPKSTPRNGAG